MVLVSDDVDTDGVDGICDEFDDDTGSGFVSSGGGSKTSPYSEGFYNSYCHRTNMLLTTSCQVNEEVKKLLSPRFVIFEANLFCPFLLSELTKLCISSHL